jgi:hypothetical protein
MSNETAYTDAEKTQVKLREGSIQMLCDRRYDFLITLTFKRPTTENDVISINTKFIKLMNTACFGRRSKKSIVVFPVIEKCKSGDRHVHMGMQDPRKRTETRSMIDLMKTIRDSWNRASTRTADVVRSSGPDEGWFEEIYDQYQLSWYLTKQIRHNSELVLDINNHTDAHRGQTANLAY